MVSTTFPTPTSALAIAAHPDDVEFGCGATIARWSAEGCTVHHLVCTDGSKGTWDVDTDIDALVARRQIEQRDAAGALGATGEVRFLGEIDGELSATLTNRSRVARVMRELRPQVVLGHDPWARWRLHPDHREAGLLTVEGIVAARDPHFFREHSLDHHRPDALLLFESEEPDLAIDVSDHAQAKAAALEAHVSQFETTMEIDDEADESQREAFRAKIADELAETGRPHGFGAAEAFRLIQDL